MVSCSGWGGRWGEVHEANEEDVEGGDARPAGDAQSDKDGDGHGKGDEVRDDVEAGLAEVEDALVDAGSFGLEGPEFVDGPALVDGDDDDGDGGADVEDVEAVDDVAEPSFLSAEAQEEDEDGGLDEAEDWKIEDRDDIGPDKGLRPVFGRCWELVADVVGRDICSG